MPPGDTANASGKLTHSLTTAIYIAKASNGVLAKSRRITNEDEAIKWDDGRFDHIGVEPMHLALAMELALKAWFVFDFNDPKFPKVHNLTKLFDSLKPEIQSRLNKEFKRSVLPLNPSAKFLDYDLRSLLVQHQDAFVDWRYFFERKKSLSFDSGFFDAAVEMVLTEFRTLYVEVPRPVLGNLGPTPS